MLFRSVQKAPYKVKLTDSSFEIELERYVERDGTLYDRLLSKWAIYKEGVERDQLVSHAHQVDLIHYQNFYEFPVKSLNYLVIICFET